MCDYIITHSGGRDDICWECREELISLKNTWEADITRDEMRERIRIFMGSEPRGVACSYDERTRIDEMFEGLIEDRRS